MQRMKIQLYQPADCAPLCTHVLYALLSPCRASASAATPLPQLPLSTFHVLLGWLDIATDILGICSTHTIVQQTSPAPVKSTGYIADPMTRMADPKPYFVGLWVTQIVLLVGNMVTQAILATITAVKSRRAGSAASGWCAFPVVAFLRGLCGMELAYHEWGKHAFNQLDAEGSRAHIQAALNYKLAELAWEAPQVMASWVIVLTRTTWLMLTHQDFSNLSVVGNVLSGCIGMTSLSLGVLEFVRISPLSYWAVAQPPTRLLLGVIDISSTWHRSLLIGMHALFSLLGRSCLYMLLFSLATTALGDMTMVSILLAVGPWLLLARVLSSTHSC